MSGFFPIEPAPYLRAALLLVGTLALGFGITRLRSVTVARIAAWFLAIAAVVAADRLSLGEPAGFRMLSLIGTLLYAMKAVVAVEAQADDGVRLTLVQWLAFSAAWAGMRPGPFRELGRRALPDANRFLVRGLSRIGLGIALALLCRPIYAAVEPAAGTTVARAAALVAALPGISLTLHFGILVVLVGIWRRAGVDCRPLFREPLRARSLSEFWGRRWNLAFTEMTALAVYRPLEVRVGRRAAMIGGFLSSGLLHEVAISVPVGTGYGLPTLYFLIQGALVLAETALERAGRPIQPPVWRGRLWTLFWVGLPIPVVFHPRFLAEIVLPLVGLTGR